MSTIIVDAGSFRDPAGHVYQTDGRVFRTVTSRAASDYEFLRQSDFLRDITDIGWFVGAKEVDPSVLGQVDEDVRYVVEHPRIPFVSYPYEWPFPALKAAARSTRCPSGAFPASSEAIGRIGAGNPLTGVRTMEFSSHPGREDLRPSPKAVRFRAVVRLRPGVSRYRRSTSESYLRCR